MSLRITGDWDSKSCYSNRPVIEFALIAKSTMLSMFPYSLGIVPMMLLYSTWKDLHDVQLDTDDGKDPLKNRRKNIQEVLFACDAVVLYIKRILWSNRPVIALLLI